jgi:hypothetical protein
MRWGLLLFGLGMLATAIGFSVLIWDTKLHPRYAQKANRLRVGMTRAKVEAVMGSEGEHGSVFISGPPDYWKEYFAKRAFFARQWEDTDAKVVVTFEGPKDEVIADRIEQLPKDPAGHSEKWSFRILLSLLALGGACLFVFALCSRATHSTVEAVPSASPPA